MKRFTANLQAQHLVHKRVIQPKLVEAAVIPLLYQSLSCTETLGLSKRGLGRLIDN